MTNTDDLPPTSIAAPGAESALRNLDGVADILSALAESAAHSHTPPEALAFLADSVIAIRGTLKAAFDACHAREAARAGKDSK